MLGREQHKIRKVSYELDPIFNIYVPTACPGVPDHILKPRNNWSDTEARQLAKLFVENFTKFLEDMPKEIIDT